jgi:hypothetical protein
MAQANNHEVEIALSLKAASTESFWEQLEKRYDIVIEANKGTVSKRGGLLGGKRQFTATAILGTKAVEVKMDSRNGVPGPIFDVEAEQTFTESNLASELRMICLFMIAQWDAAQKAGSEKNSGRRP